MDDRDRDLRGPVDRVIRPTRGDTGGSEGRALRPALDANSALNLTPMRVPGSAPGSWLTGMTTGQRGWVTGKFRPAPQLSAGLPAPKGPPWLYGYLLYTGTTEELGQVIRSDLFDFDEVTAHAVILTYIGDPREIGPAYEILRDDKLKKHDEASARTYEEMIHAGTADYHRRREVFRLRKRLGIARVELPCILFYTDPPCTPPAFLKIRPAWLADESARHGLAEALLDFFETTGVNQLARSCGTIAELARKFEGLINKHMVERLGLERGEQAPKGIHVFQRQGRTWLLVYDGVTSSVVHSVGMSYIAELLAAPEQQIDAAGLWRTVSRGGPTRFLGSAAEVVDRKALEAYQAEARDLQEEIQDAEANNDSGRVENLKTDLAMIMTQINGAIGLGGKPRMTSPDLERVRKTVSQGIHRALISIQKDHAPLWKHLRSSLKIGTSLSYQPAGRTHWTL